MKIVIALLLLALSGCAQFTEEYWQEEYAKMTEAEKESAENVGPDLVTVCTLEDCAHIWIY